MAKHWLQLFRIALAPTIVWDVVAGWLIWQKTSATQSSSTTLLVTLATVLLVYHGGMALNDWADRRIDFQANRKRPLALGVLPANTALAIGLLMVLGSVALAAWALPTSLAAAALLAFIVLLYDLGGSLVRTFLGPALLASARVLAFHMAPLGEAEWETVISSIGFVPGAALAVWWLFLSRLASYEEKGAPGMHILGFPVILALVPLMLSEKAGVDLWFYILWGLLAGWLLIPAWQKRHDGHSAYAVQAAVRRALISSPLIPGAILLAAGLNSILIAGILVVVLTTTRTLAKVFPPE